MGDTGALLLGYVLATVFTLIGLCFDEGTEAHYVFTMIDFAKFKNMQWYPDFTFVQAFKDTDFTGFGSFLGTIAVAYVPVAFVVFAEHIADHKNLSSIIEHDLLDDPGLSRTLLGDGLTVNEYADIAHLNRNEALCRLGRRVPKIYIKDNKDRLIG